jgi:hypothetical protein
MDADLHAAIENAYRVFAAYELRGELEVCRCNSCVGPEQERLLATTPVRALSRELLSEYTHSAHGWSDRVAGELRHFLPRYFELIAAHEDPCQFGTCLDRLADAAYRYDWPKVEADAVDDFFAALFRARITASARYVDFGGVASLDDNDAEDVLCTAASAGVDLAPMLDVWSATQTRDADLRLAGLIASAHGTAQQASDLFRHGGNRPLIVAATAQVFRWLSRPEIHERLEAACLRETDPTAAALLSQAEGLLPG